MFGRFEEKLTTAMNNLKLMLTNEEKEPKEFITYFIKKVKSALGNALNETQRGRMNQSQARDILEKDVSPIIYDLEETLKTHQSTFKIQGKGGQSSTHHEKEKNVMLKTII